MISQNFASMRPARWFSASIAVMSLLFAAFFAANAHAVAVIEKAKSDFESGFDGWGGWECLNLGLCAVPIQDPIQLGGTVGDLDPTEFKHNATGGSPLGPFPGGGHLQIVDPGGDSTGLYTAPPKFTNVLAAGDTLSFDYYFHGMDFENDQSPYPNDVVLVQLHNADFTVVYAIPEPAVETWLQFDVLMSLTGNPGFWVGVSNDGTTIVDNKAGEDAFLTAIFDIIITDPNVVLKIWGETTKDDPDADGSLLDNVYLTAPIPVPAALPLLISALAGLGFAARRKR